MSYLQSQNTGETRALKSKSGRKKSLQVEMSLRLQPKPNVVIIHNCTQLWVTSWLTNGSVKDLGDAFHHLVLSYLIINTDTHPVFDRYYGHPIKGLTRAQRTGSNSLNHVLSLSTSIPSKEDTMLSNGNKVQIYHLCHLYHLYHLKVLNRKVGKHKL